MLTGKDDHIQELSKIIEGQNQELLQLNDSFSKQSEAYQFLTQIHEEITVQNMELRDKLQKISNENFEVTQQIGELKQQNEYLENEVNCKSEEINSTKKVELALQEQFSKLETYWYTFF